MAVPPGKAQATGPMPSVTALNCATLTGLRPNFSGDVVLDGRSLGQWLPADGSRIFWPGDVVEITARGSINGGGVFDWVGSHDPNGVADLAPAGGLWPLPGARKWSLVGDFNDDLNPFFIGTGPRCFRWNGTTNPSLLNETFLYFRFNDDIPDDNSGSFNIHVDSFWCQIRPDC
jgi:hypothetical protein